MTTQVKMTTQQERKDLTVDSANLEQTQSKFLSILKSLKGSVVNKVSLVLVAALILFASCKNDGDSENTSLEAFTIESIEKLKKEVPNAQHIIDSIKKNNPTYDKMKMVDRINLQHEIIEKLIYESVMNSAGEDDIE